MRCLLFVVRSLLLVVRCLLCFVRRCWLYVVHRCSLFNVNWLLRVDRSVWFVVCCLVFADWWMLFVAGYVLFVV